MEVWGKAAQIINLLSASFDDARAKNIEDFEISFCKFSLKQTSFCKCTFLLVIFNSQSRLLQRQRSILIS
jgi:hypothetical protein